MGLNGYSCQTGYISLTNGIEDSTTHRKNISSMINIEKLKQEVCDANIALVSHELVIFTWGNVSAIDRTSGLVTIKPSGIDYNAMKPEDMVVLDLDGNVVDGKLKPSSDAPTHLELYHTFSQINAVVHTHSTYATAWAQAQRAIPCFGTTHADYFYGKIPCTRPMSTDEIKTDYELNTGRVIVETFKKLNIEAAQMPSVLVANQGPFSWGKNANDAVHNAVVLEELAKMALLTERINKDASEISRDLLDKHYLRKHGKNAYYGQS